jgi:hypothetical protein
MLVAEFGLPDRGAALVVGFSRTVSAIISIGFRQGIVGGRQRCLAGAGVVLLNRNHPPECSLGLGEPSLAVEKFAERHKESLPSGIRIGSSRLWDCP